MVGDVNGPESSGADRSVFVPSDVREFDVTVAPDLVGDQRAEVSFDMTDAEVEDDRSVQVSVDLPILRVSEGVIAPELAGHPSWAAVDDAFEGRAAVTTADVAEEFGDLPTEGERPALLLPKGLDDDVRFDVAYDGDEYEVVRQVPDEGLDAATEVRLPGALEVTEVSPHVVAYDLDDHPSREETMDRLDDWESATAYRIATEFPATSGTVAEETDRDRDGVGGRR